MSNVSTHDMPSPLILAIEDAVLFGNTQELDDILDLVADNEKFPEPLRHGLEALRYFRTYYGKDGELAPDQFLKKQKIALMESAWGAELLDLLRRSDSKTVVKSA